MKIGDVVYLVFKGSNYADVIEAKVRTVFDDSFVATEKRTKRAYLRFFSQEGVLWSYDREEALEQANIWEDTILCHDMV